MIKELFKSYSRLSENLAFVHGNKGIVAECFDVEVYSMLYDKNGDMSEKAFNIMKQETHKILKNFSSTVMLKTACDCSRFATLLSDVALKSGLRVDIFTHRPLATKIDAFAATRTFQERVFKFKGNHTDDGFKILEEQI